MRRLAGRRGHVLERFTARLGSPVPADELLLQLVEALKRSLKAHRTEAWIVEGDRVRRAVSVPHRGEGDEFTVGAHERRLLSRPDVYGVSWARTWMPELLEGRERCSLRVAPVVSEGEPLAVLVVERARRDDFVSGEEAVIAELARHLGLSLHNERLRIALQATLLEVQRANDELRASRTRVVKAADAERRRIERDLHDGAQQRLIALSIELRLARDALGAITGEAADRLDRAEAAVAGAMDELADLANGIYPPVLRDSGLAAALKVAARRHTAPVRLDVTGVGRHAAAIEAAIYFAVVEALQNAAKHASGAQVAVTLREHDGEIDFAVADDGPGFALDAVRRGNGMLNMQDRIGGLGGTLTWESAAGAGTVVRGTLAGMAP